MSSSAERICPEENKNPRGEIYYQKSELVELARRRLGMSKYAANKKSKSDLCRRLNIPMKTVSKAVAMAYRLREDDETRAVRRKPVQKPVPVGDCMERSKLKIKNHQKKVINYMKDHRGLIVVHSVGSGKTLTGVAYSQCFLDDFPDRKVVVVTPKSLQRNFKKEMKAYGLSVRDPRYKFYTYNGFLNAGSAGKESCRGNLIIIDEVHNLRTIPGKVKGKDGRYKTTGKMAKALVKCCIKAKKVLLLSATPIVNSIADIHPMVSMVDGKKMMESAKEFKASVAEPAQLREYIRKKFSVFSPSNVERQRDYPGIRFFDKFIEMDKKFLKDYKKIESQEFSDRLIRLFGEKDWKAFYNGVRRAVNSLEMSNSPKVKFVTRIIESAEGSRKFLVYSHFKKSGLALIEKRLEDKGIDFRRIDGQISKRLRSEYVDLYNRGVVKVLLISKAGSEGLDLKGTNSIILLEPSWNETTIRQVIGRGVRYKSHEGMPESQRTVYVYKLYMHTPEEGKLLNVLKNNVYTRMPNPDGSEDPKGEKLSIDMFLRNFSLNKQDMVDLYMNMIKEESIEIRD